MSGETQGELLFPVFRVHCFFGGCGHTVDDPDPDRAHDRMEDHYDRDHRADLARLGY